MRFKIFLKRSNSNAWEHLGEVYADNSAQALSLAVALWRYERAELKAEPVRMMMAERDEEGASLGR